MSDTFPSIKIPTKRTKTYKKAQIRTEYENGVVQSRPRYTKGRFVFLLEWNNLSLADYDLLIQHFQDNTGSSFTCSSSMLFGDNEADKTYYEDKTLIYAEDELAASSSDIPGFVSISITLEEM